MPLRCRNSCPRGWLTVYHEKDGRLCSALGSEETRPGVVDAISALIETIEPGGDELKIALKGDLAGMLGGQRQRQGTGFRPPGPNKAALRGGI
jgi:hypothetical protein